MFVDVVSCGLLCVVVALLGVGVDVANGVWLSCGACCCFVVVGVDCCGCGVFAIVVWCLLLCRVLLNALGLGVVCCCYCCCAAAASPCAVLVVPLLVCCVLFDCLCVFYLVCVVAVAGVVVVVVRCCRCSFSSSASSSLWLLPLLCAVVWSLLPPWL